MTAPRNRLTIGELAARSGLAASALRYYEDLGLIHSERTAGGQRRYQRAALRRVAFVRAAQRVGLSLEEARRALDALPDERPPTAAEWARVASAWQRRIDAQIAELQRLRTRLGSCIGCGCLSLRSCGLYNPDDTASGSGSGARYLLGEEPPGAGTAVTRARTGAPPLDDEELRHREPRDTPPLPPPCRRPPRSSPA